MVKFQVDGSGFGGSKVVLKKGGKTVESLPGKGRMTFSLDYGYDYMFTFRKEGYITKRIAVNTQRVPMEMQEEDNDFDFAVEIFKQYEGVNTVVFNQPVAKYYSSREDEFTYDTDYTKSIQSALLSFEEYEEIKKNRDLRQRSWPLKQKQRPKKRLG